MTSRKVGPPNKTYSEEILKEIIYRYKTFEKPNGKITYSAVWEYAKNDWYEFKCKQNLSPTELRDVKKYTSEDLWRKNNRKTGEPNSGKRLINEVNSVKNYFIKSSKNKIINVPSVVDVINKLTSKEEMIESLQPLEVLCLKLLETEKGLKDEIEKLKSDLEFFKVKAEKQEESIFQLARYSRSSESILKNVLNTGSSKHKLVEEALENIFINPMNFLYKDEKIEPSSEKVVSITERKQKITDTYGL